MEAEGYRLIVQEASSACRDNKMKVGKSECPREGALDVGGQPDPRHENKRLSGEVQPGALCLSTKKVDPAPCFHDNRVLLSPFSVSYVVLQ